MIYVTVGTHTAQFERLIVAAEMLASQGDDEVVVQHGASRPPLGVARSFSFCSSGEMNDLIVAARVVVCQAADTVLDVLRARRPVVAVPRQARFGEHLNDHQVDFARALATRGWIVMIEDPSDGLGLAIERALRLPAPPVPDIPPLAVAVRETLLGWFPNAQPSSDR